MSVIPMCIHKKEHVISFADVKSCATATAKSVPCMFSDLKRESFDDVEASIVDNLLCYKKGRY